jgi:hypothetical protein
MERVELLPRCRYPVLRPFLALIIELL